MAQFSHNRASRFSAAYTPFQGLIRIAAFLSLTFCLSGTNTASAGIIFTIQPNALGETVISLSTFGTATTVPTASGSTLNVEDDGVANFSNGSGDPFNGFFSGFNASATYAANDFTLENPLETDFGGTSYFLQRVELEDDGASSGVDDYSFAFSDGVTDAGLVFPFGPAVNYSVVDTGISRILNGGAPIAFAGNFNVGTFTDSGDADSQYFNGMQLVVSSTVAASAAVPEPKTFGFIALALMGLGFYRRKHREPSASAGQP